MRKFWFLNYFILQKCTQFLLALLIILLDLTVTLFNEKILTSIRCICGFITNSNKKFNSYRGKVHIFWEGHKFLRNLHCRFVLCSNGQIYSGDFAKICGLLRIYELYISFQITWIFYYPFKIYGDGLISESTVQTNFWSKVAFLREN